MFNHETLRSTLAEAGSHFVSVRFIKADGSERQMTVNPRHFLETKGTGKPASDPNIFRVVDAKLGQWRSFDARRVISIKVSGEVIQGDA
jgi:hypothetical protein